MEEELRTDEGTNEIANSAFHSSFYHPTTMGEDRIDITVTRKIIEIEISDIRMKSTKKGVANNGVKIMSRYLRSSTGSCHDFCKYGQKHTSEAEAKSPMLKRIAVMQGEEQYLEKTHTLAKKNKKSVTGLKPSPDSKTQIPEPLIIKTEVTSTGKGIDVSTRRAIDFYLKSTKTCVLPTAGCASIKRSNCMRKNPLEGSSIRRHSVIGIGKEMGTSKMHEKDSSIRRHSAIGISTEMRTSKMGEKDSSIHRNSGIGIGKELRTSKTGEKDSSIRRNSGIGIGKELRTSKMGAKEVLVPPVASLPPRPSVKRAASTNAGNYKNLRGRSHWKNRNSARKAKLEQGSDEPVPEKIIHVVEPVVENKTVGPGQNGTHSTQWSPSSEDKSSRHAHHRIKTVESSPASKNKNLSQTRNGNLTTRSPPFSENKSLRRSRNRIHSTLSSSHPSSSSLSSLSSFMSQSESKLSGENGSISKRNKTGTAKQLESQKVESKRRPRRGGINSSEDKNFQPQKLNFRRGKVVDLQSENNSPRRLRFRRGRVLGENQNGKDDTKRGSYQRREVVDGELNGKHTESKKVVLKHQDVEGKKDGQSLFNNVIEETASKLAKTRKSKVKALVGAFETVISLQETTTY